MEIINLTLHDPSPQQEEEGVFNYRREEVKQALLFESMPPYSLILERAGRLAVIASESGAEYAMIGGAPYLMAPLERALFSKGIPPIYAFSTRESVEKVVDGKAVKTSVFEHQGFIEAKGIDWGSYPFDTLISNERAWNFMTGAHDPGILMGFYTQEFFEGCYLDLKTQVPQDLLEFLRKKALSYKRKVLEELNSERISLEEAFLVSRKAGRDTNINIKKK